MTRRALLYTEMLTANAVIHGKRSELLGHSAFENPVALQLGGADPARLAEAAAIGEAAGYDEINLNCGCPSDRVQGGNFGACLMGDPALVAECVSRMQRAVRVPVTVKCRIGIDDQDSEADLERFITRVADAGCSTFIVHARKAWLHGLSPKENREIPPLDYPRVWRLKAAHPELTIVINGGLTSLAEAKSQLQYVDGVMLGRAAYHTPWLLAEVDPLFFGDEAPDAAVSREAVLAALRPYVESHLASGGRLHAVTRHVLGLYHARPRGRLFRRFLSENTASHTAGIAVIDRVIAEMAAPMRRSASE